MMKRKHLIFALIPWLLLCLFMWLWQLSSEPKVARGNGQANHPGKKLMPGLDWNSQSNIDVIVSGGDDALPCPPEYTNVISNTNLFTPDEQKLLKAIPLEYGNVTTNSGPPGTVRLSLHRWRDLNWIAYFQYTNSDMQDKVVFGRPQTHYVRNKAEDGYDIHYWTEEYRGTAVPEFQLSQFKHGVPNGLFVELHGDRCAQWMRFSNGLAVEQWLYWTPDNQKLDIWVKFKEPYDYLKHSRRSS